MERTVAKDRNEAGWYKEEKRIVAALFLISISNLCIVILAS